MAAPAFINELTAAGSLSAGAALVVFQDGDTFRTTPQALITEAASFTPSGSGAIARSVQAALRDIGFNVKSFGAVGDGSTDDYAAILAAITAANGGGRVIFPPGNYKLGTALSLSGLSNIEFVFHADATLLPAHSDHAITISDCDDLTFRGFRISGASMLASKTGVLITNNSARIKFFDGTSVAWAEPTFTLRTCDQVTIDGFWAIDMPAAAAFLDSHESTNLVINDAHGRPASGVTALDNFIDLKANTADSRNIQISNISAHNAACLVGFGTEINTGFVLENVVVTNGIAIQCIYPIYIKPEGGGTFRNFHISGIWFEDAAGVQLKSGLRWEGFNSSGGTISNGYIQMRGRGSFAGSSVGDRIAFHLGDGSNVKLDLEFESVDGTNDLRRAISLRGDMDEIDLAFNCYGFQGVASLGIYAEGVNADIGNIRIHDFTMRTVSSGSEWLRTDAATVSGFIEITDGIVDSGTIKTVTDVGTGVSIINVKGNAVIEDDVGNASKTLTAGVSEPTQVWNTAINQDRTVTLSTTGAFAGAKFRIVRTAASTGAFNLNVGTGPLAALVAGEWCEVEYDGAAWVLTAFGALA